MRHQRNASLFSIYLAASFTGLALVGLWACLYLVLALPGGPEHALLTGLSASRLLLALFDLAVATGLAYLGSRCWRSRPTLDDFLSSIFWRFRLRQPGLWAIGLWTALFLLSFLALVICWLALAAPLEELHLSAYEAFRLRLWPNLVWSLIASLWMLLNSIIGYIAAYRLEKSLARQYSAASTGAIQDPALGRVRSIQTLLVALFLLAVHISLFSFPYAVWGGDTDDYLYMAGKSIFSREFYAGPRPLATGLLYKLLGANLGFAEKLDEVGVVHDAPNARAVVIAQVLISAASWIALGFAAAGLLSTPWLRPLALGAILLTALSPAVFSWNRILLSESLSSSLMVLLLASWLWLAKDWQWHKLILLCAVSVLWAFTRETNDYLVLGMAGLLLLAAGLGWLAKGRKKRGAYCMLAIFFILLFLFSSSLSDLRNRWATSLANVIFLRILPDQQALAYFQDQGMPSGPEVRAMEGKWSCSDNCAFFKEPKYQVFRQWLVTHGRRVYAGYLLANPLPSLAAPLANLGELSGSTLSLPDLPGLIAPIPGWLAKIVYFQGFGALLFWLDFLLAALLVAWRAWRTQTALGVVLGLLLLAYPHAFLVYHGDAIGMARHAIQFGVQVRLVFWLLLLLVFDFALPKLSLALRDRNPEQAV